MFLCVFSSSDEDCCCFFFFLVLSTLFQSVLFVCLLLEVVVVVCCFCLGFCGITLMGDVSVLISSSELFSSSSDLLSSFSVSLPSEEDVFACWSEDECIDGAPELFELSSESVSDSGSCFFCGLFVCFCVDCCWLF